MKFSDSDPQALENVAHGNFHTKNALQTSRHPWHRKTERNFTPHSCREFVLNLALWKQRAATAQKQEIVYNPVLPFLDCLDFLCFLGFPCCVCLLLFGREKNLLVFEFACKEGFFSEKGGRHSVNEGSGKDFYRKGNSVKRFGPFSEPHCRTLNSESCCPHPHSPKSAPT